jgi:cephalosporin-C deacetylase-like acetyl esterase
MTLIHLNRLFSAAIFLILPFFTEGQVWDMDKLMDTPFYRVLKQDTVVSLIYQGLEYRENPKDVFAYYCTPGLLSGDRSADRHLPAMVLVHGGGGTAFREWVVYWAKRGYAAIAMDMRGFGEGRQPLENGFKEPVSGTPYFAVGDTQNEHWLYQAVGDVVLAHSLIRSFSEIDSSCTALTGISWGGVITCIVAGLDSRFKAFAPVYGCGYLYEHSAMAKSINELPSVQYEKWVNWYDPSNYIGRTNRPVLFMNGTNDYHFYPDIYRKTYSLVDDYTLCLKPRMEHGHRLGWENNEIYTFVNHIMNGTPALPAIGNIQKTQYNIGASVNSVIPVVEATLNYTTDTCELKSREWKSLPANYKDGRIGVDKIPGGTTIWYFSVTDENRNFVSGDIVFEEH